MQSEETATDFDDAFIDELRRKELAARARRSCQEVAVQTKRKLDKIIGWKRFETGLAIPIHKTNPVLQLPPICPETFGLSKCYADRIHRFRKLPRMEAPPLPKLRAHLSRRAITNKSSSFEELSWDASAYASDAALSRGDVARLYYRCQRDILGGSNDARSTVSFAKRIERSIHDKSRPVFF